MIMAKVPKSGDVPRPRNVLAALRHDGADYGPGDIVDLTDAEADDLAPFGVIASGPVEGAA